MPVKPTTTALLLTGSAADIVRARQVLATVDVRPLQINYEAKVIETSVNNDDQHGLLYNFGGAQHNHRRAAAAGRNTRLWHRLPAIVPARY